MFDWLKKLFKRKQQNIPTIEQLHKEDNYETVEYHPNPKVEEESRKLETEIEEVTKRLKELKEEQVKEDFLPTPKTHRMTHPRSYIPPAEQHREVISKFMKGKGGSQRYRKTIKQSPKMKIEED